MAQKAKKLSTKEKQDKQLREDISSFKSSVAFILFCIVIVFTTSVIRGQRGVNVKAALLCQKWYFILPFAVLLALCGVWRYLSFKKKKDEGLSYFNSYDALGIAFFLFGYVNILGGLASGTITALIGYTVLFAVCTFVKQFFTRDFFAASLVNADIAALIGIVGKKFTFSTGFGKAIVFILMAAAAALAVVSAVKAIQNKKLMKDEGLTYLPAIISAVIGIVLVLLVKLIPAFTVLLAEIVLLVQFVALGVVYTVRMLNR